MDDIWAIDATRRISDYCGCDDFVVGCPMVFTQKGGEMRLTDTMQIFRRIIGVIARIDKTGWVILEYIMQDLDVDIVDLRVWLRLMEVMGLVDFWCESDRVVLRLMYLDALGFDISKLEEL